MRLTGATNPRPRAGIIAITGTGGGGREPSANGVEARVIEPLGRAAHREGIVAELDLQKPVRIVEVEIRIGIAGQHSRGFAPSALSGDDAHREVKKPADGRPEGRPPRHYRDYRKRRRTACSDWVAIDSD